MGVTKTCLACHGPLPSATDMAGLPAEVAAWAGLYCPACTAERLQRNETCPRCGGVLRHFLGDLGALSRSDQKTIVCGPCGEDEAAIWGGDEGRLEVLPSWAEQSRPAATRLQLPRRDRDA